MPVFENMFYLLSSGTLISAHPKIAVKPTATNPGKILFINFLSFI